jgi:hypothetical protein
VCLAICRLISPTAAFAQDNTGAAAKGEMAPAKSVTTNAPADNKTPLLSVEIAPASAYPEPFVRGITGASLWLTSQGWQWPYLPGIEGGPALRLAFSGSVWVDTAYARIISGTPDTDKSQKRWTNQGRGVLRATPTYSTEEGWFGQAQIEFVANGDQFVPSSGNIGAVDDLYVRAGKWGVFDITAGRFQGWELYHYGMGLDLNTLERRGAEGRNNPVKPPQIYGLDFFWDRPNGGAGDYAAHVYFGKRVRLEVLGQIGTATGSNLTAIRPVGIVDLGFLKLKAGFEWGKAVPQQDGGLDETTKNGFGGAVQFVANPYIEGGVNGAVGFVDSVNFQGLRDGPGSTTTRSIGGFLNGRVYGPLILGLGLNFTHQDNLEKNGTQGSPNFGKSDVYDHFQGFFAIQYAVWDRLFFKFVGSYANFHFEDNLQDPPHSFSNQMWGGRLRVLYLF